MKLVVPEEVLMIYKEIVDNYAVHTPSCSHHMVEVCDCGLTKKVHKLINLSYDAMKLVKEDEG